METGQGFRASTGNIAWDRAEGSGRAVRLANAVMRLRGIKRALLAFGAGAFGALALPPFSLFATLFVSLPLLVWLLDGGRAHLRSAFGLSWLFGFGYFVAGLWWLGNALLLEADAFAWALPLAIFGLPAFLAIFYGVATALARLLWSDGLGRIAALAAAFGLAEWLRGFVATGFTWNAIGYGIMPVPVMMQSAHLVGIFGMSALTVFICASPALAAAKKGRVAGLLLAAGLMLAHFSYGAYRLQQAMAPGSGDLVVRIVQPGIDQSRKMLNADRAEIFQEHLDLSALPPAEGKGRRPDLIVWPETSLPFLLTQSPDALKKIAAILEDGQILLTGAVRMEEDGEGRPPRFYNSVYAIDSQGGILGVSDKVHLVPFGEYVPFETVLRKFGVDNVIPLPVGFSPAAGRRSLTLPSGKVLYPFICYEIIFPEELPQDIALADAILNVTNDGWFGDSPGPYQHFQQARLRAVETGLPVIRAANTGISATIDPWGRIVEKLDYGQKGIIDSTMSGALNTSIDGFWRQRHFWLLFSVFFVMAVVSRFGLYFNNN